MNTDNPHKVAKSFLEANGRPLGEFGSSDYGLSRADSIRFIDVVRQNRLNVLGVEVWRHKGSRYKIDSLMTWYAIEKDVTSNLAEVQDFVETIDLAENDLLAIQTT